MTADPVGVLVAGPQQWACEALSRCVAKYHDFSALGIVSSEELLSDAVQLTRPDLVVVDTVHAGWKGAEACQVVKALDELRRVVVVGPAGSDALLAAVQAGADGYVDDGETLDAFIAALRVVHRGEARIPPGTLGSLLANLISTRRKDDAAMELLRRLSDREREVLALISQGADTRSIAAQLFVSPHTARTHIQNVFAKLEVHSRLEAVTFVLDHNLLDHCRAPACATHAAADQKG